ncbi:MAG TPA: hypothetical protein VEY87_01685 [Gaiellaceae bacterium]|nr:hypothetical protein [Gaiellaceae bacterium]
MEACSRSLEACGDEQVEALARRDQRLGTALFDAAKAHDSRRLSTR